MKGEVLSVCRDITALNVSQAYGFSLSHIGWGNPEKFCLTFVSISCTGSDFWEGRTTTKKSERKETGY